MGSHLNGLLTRRYVTVVRRHHLPGNHLGSRLFALSVDKPGPIACRQTGSSNTFQLRRQLHGGHPIFVWRTVSWGKVIPQYNSAFACSSYCWPRPAAAPPLSATGQRPIATHGHPISSACGISCSRPTANPAWRCRRCRVRPRLTNRHRVFILAAEISSALST